MTEIWELMRIFVAQRAYSNMHKVLTIAFICLSFLLPAHGENFYRDYLTGFSDMSVHASESGPITINNTSRLPVFETKQFNTCDRSFFYQIRLKPGSGKSKFLIGKENQTFGIVWNYIDNLNYDAISFQLGNSAPYDDVTAIKHLRAEAYHISNDKKSVYFTKEILSDIDTEGGYNSVCISFDGKQRLKFEIGQKQLSEIASIDSIRFNATSNIGFFAAPQNRLSVKRIEFQSFTNKENLYHTAYTKQQIDSIFKHSNDPNEGYWEYFDRKMDESRLKLGGKYRIAVVKSGNGYDILYVSGAATLTELWSPLMLKGTLSETAFIDNYNLTWIGSNKDVLTEESYAFFSTNLLTIKLPLLDSEVRFAKMLVPQKTNSPRNHFVESF